MFLKKKKKKGGTCVCVSVFLYTEIKDSLWAAGSASASRPSVLLAGDCCVAMETPVERWFYKSFSLSLSLSSHLGSFHNTHNTQNFRFERASSWRQIGSQFMRTEARPYRCQTERPKGRKRKKTENTCTLAHTQCLCRCKKGRTNIVNAKMMLVHSWRGEHSHSLLLFAFYSFAFVSGWPWVPGVNDETVNNCTPRYSVSLQEHAQKKKISAKQSVKYLFFFSLSPSH